eukprot:sb/3476069/
MNPGRRLVTDRGPIQEEVSWDAVNIQDDPIFVNTHGLGNDYCCDPLTGTTYCDGLWQYDISNIQHCPHPSCTNIRVQGTDHGSASYLKTGPVYGNYAIYISKSANHFPPVGTDLNIVMGD